MMRPAEKAGRSNEGANLLSIRVAAKHHDREQARSYEKQRRSLGSNRAWTDE